MDKLVDFSQPIEAHLADGRTVNASLVQGTIGGTSFRVHIAGFGAVTAEQNGRAFGGLITIRNAAKPSAPSTPSNEELRQRMGEEAIDLLCKLAQEKPGGEVWDRSRLFGQWIERAQSFISDLPNPVDPIDPDLRHAREIAVTFNSGARIAEEIIAGKRDEEESVKALVKAIKLGRTLAAGGTAHE